MVRYDENVIQRYAATLYARVGSMVGAYTLVGLVNRRGDGVPLVALGGGGGGGLAGQQGLLLLVPVVLGGVLGYWIGSARAFVLRLQAQVALCQVAIERNTRGAGAWSVAEGAASMAAGS